MKKTTTTTEASQETIVLKTNQGDITVALLREDAPNIVQNFVDLAKEGKYDDTIFHRVIEGFMIQGGDYENRNGTGGQAANGGMIEDEFSPNLSHVRGVLSMANRGPNTNGSQFFIVQQDQPHLDGRHSIFGQVTDGMDVVDAIAASEKDGMDRPVEEVVIESIDFQ
ncbi:UNVERIFIED_CONTAM: hypothetical protein GTU68_050540 [Idotea baltica]|nr:hypothetical protein [Idotea baltica]